MPPRPPSCSSDDELYSGWGVRTLSSRAAGYNPLGYHTGTVWPHDNALIAAGLARYGHRDAALTIAGSILAAAPYFEHRLPEVFAGYPASATGVPVAFPTASRPQAWAAGAPLLLLTTVLGLEPGDDDADAPAPSGDGRVTLHRSGRSAGARPALSSEQRVHVRQPVEPRERPVVRDLLRRLEPSAPRGPRERAADADPAHAERLRVRDRP